MLHCTNSRHDPCQMICFFFMCRSRPHHVLLPLTGSPAVPHPTQLQFTALHALLSVSRGVATAGSNVFAPPGASLLTTALLVPRSPVRGVATANLSIRSTWADSPLHSLTPGCPTQHSSAWLPDTALLSLALYRHLTPGMIAATSCVPPVTLATWAAWGENTWESESARAVSRSSSPILLSSASDIMQLGLRWGCFEIMHRTS
ncbi:hypothetical protein NDU88_003195 [Pleurodeles waltl]|uniref:Uncharacterized protein n=1 Tax=Pleurodeles waltl TaxID=8319 RepID=A0AAV7MQY0_PLEWA|nr:hypothetical protein NDU88_003195 [Pleurodeles waltl]